MKIKRADGRLNAESARIILAYADANMSATRAAKIAYHHRGTIINHLAYVKTETGLDGRNFHDLVKLVAMAKEALADVDD